jgi:cell division initiation protein
VKTDNRSGYSPEEFRKILDKIIDRVEQMTNDNKQKDIKIRALEEENKNLSLSANNSEEVKRKLEQYERMEATLNKAIMMAQKTSDQMRLAAHKESEVIIDDAKKNANRIVNEALQKAEKIESDSEVLTRNMRLFKKRIREVIESQLEVVNDLDKIEF